MGLDFRFSLRAAEQHGARFESTADRWYEYTDDGEVERTALWQFLTLPCGKTLTVWLYVDGDVSITANTWGDAHEPLMAFLNGNKIPFETF